MRILIVDDERQITRVLRTSLQSSGYEVTVANNGLEAFELFSTVSPDLVITDLAMPEMTGIELTRAIRRTSDRLFCDRAMLAQIGQWDEP